MLNKIKSGIGMSTLGLALMVSSGNASAAGPVTFLWYDADYYTLLVSTSGGGGCGATSATIPAANIAGAVAILASAEASGRNVDIRCDLGYMSVQMY